MQLAVRGKAFECGDFTFDRRRRQDAGTNHCAADDHRAGSALHESATEARALQTEVIPEDVKQQSGWLDNAVALNDGERSLASGIGVTETMPGQSGSLPEQTKPALGFSPGYKGRNYLRKALLEQKLGKPLQERNLEINQYFEGLKTDPDYDKSLVQDRLSDSP